MPRVGRHCHGVMAVVFEYMDYELGWTDEQLYLSAVAPPYQMRHRRF